jgi:hypothetical protein
MSNNKSKKITLKMMINKNQRRLVRIGSGERAIYDKHIESLHVIFEK